MFLMNKTALPNSFANSKTDNNMSLNYLGSLFLNYFAVEKNGIGHDS